METKQLTVTELTKSPIEIKKFMYDYFDFLINNYKIQSMSEWERNNSMSDDYWKEKIKELIIKKNDLTEEISKVLGSEEDISIKLELKFESNSEKKQLETHQMKVSA